MRHLKETLIDILPSIKIYEKLKIRKSKVNNYFCITALEDGKITFTHYNNDLSLYYSFDLQKWVKWDFSDIKINQGDNVYFLGDNKDGFTKKISNSNRFEINTKVNISGNLLSLINGNYNSYTFTNEDMQTNCCFACLFKFSYGIIDASKLILPDNVTEGCFAQMFSLCKSLTKAPELPAEDLANSCYELIFNGCASLTEAPELPATNLAPNCYLYMFKNCVKLTQAPELPATTLANRCYENMFSACISLTKGPELPATNLTQSCYKEMFAGCNLLTVAPELPATNLTQSCYKGMFVGCTNLKAAPELPATNLADSCYKEMFAGCNLLTVAPELPATTLANRCYENMFSACISLTKGPELPATKMAPHCYQEMFMNSAIQEMPVIKSKIKISNTSVYTRNMFKGTSISN